MRFRLPALVLAAATLVAGPAAAQLGTPIDEHSTLLSELVVPAPGGPPWWKVTDGDSTVYVLANPGAAPMGFSFNQRMLEARLKDANEVILSPRVRYQAIGAFALPQSKRLIADVIDNGGSQLEPSLPEALRARFVAAREKVGQPESRYGALPPGLAGMVLAADYDRLRRGVDASVGAGGSPVERTVEVAARRAHVSAKPAKVYGGPTMSLVLEAARQPDEACLSAILDRLEAPLATSQRAAAFRAWAEGDVRPLLDEMLANPNARAINGSVSHGQKRVGLKYFTQACMDQMPDVRKVQLQFIGDQTEAIDRALKKPGHAVAVVDAGALLMSGGVLDRLRQRGLTVTAPSVE